MISISVVTAIHIKYTCLETPQYIDNTYVYRHSHIYDTHVYSHSYTIPMSKDTATHI